MNRIKRTLIYSLKLLALVVIIYLSYKLRVYQLFTGYYELKKEAMLISSSRDTLPSKFILIAHAGGGVAGKTYLNTLEALNQSIKLGYKFIEIDINQAKDSTYVLSHNFVDMPVRLYIANKTNGTHLSLLEFLKWLQNKDVKIITDTKINTLEVLTIIRNSYPDLIKKIIPQVYSIAEINTVRKMGFRNIIFTNYISNYPFLILIKLANAKTLYGITIPYSGLKFQLIGLTNLIKKSPTPFFTHTVNKQEQMSIAQKGGIKGIYTDFILPTSKKK